MHFCTFHCILVNRNDIVMPLQQLRVVQEGVEHLLRCEPSDPDLLALLNLWYASAKARWGKHRPAPASSCCGRTALRRAGA